MVLYIRDDGSIGCGLVLTVWLCEALEIADRALCFCEPLSFAELLCFPCGGAETKREQIRRDTIRLQTMHD